MSEELQTITRGCAITLINNSIENFFTFYDSYCHDNSDLSKEQINLYDQINEVMMIVKNDKNYLNDLKIMPVSELTNILMLCKQMVEINDLSTRFSYPKGEFVIIDNNNDSESLSNNLIGKALGKLELHSDSEIQNAIKEWKTGEREIMFASMSENTAGETIKKNDSYTHYINSNYSKDSTENEVRVAITMAHEFKRKAQSNTLSGETCNLILEDTKIIESFANDYGEEIYKKFPEYGILHYIKKIFGETELKDFAEYTFDSTGSYWKVNDSGDLIDDGNVLKVFDVNGKEQKLNYESDNDGRQGTLEKWLGIKNAFTTLMQPAGYKYDGTKWSTNPGKIDHSKIEDAYKAGKLTEDQYNMIQLAAGLAEKSNEKTKKISLFSQILTSYQEANEIKTQIQIDMTNRAWEFIKRKWNEWFGKEEKEKINNTGNHKVETSFTNLMNSIQTDDLHSPCCDEYCTRILVKINKKPSDWPSPHNYKICKTSEYTGLNYKDFYSSKWKDVPAEGWNVMIMWANKGEKYEKLPHMAMLQKVGNKYNLAHFTGDTPLVHEGWSFSQVENGFNYSNFKYMSIGL